MLSLAARAGMPLTPELVVSLDMMPLDTVDLAERAGLRLSLAQVAGAPPRNMTSFSVYFSCEKRQVMASHARALLAHCGPVTAAEAFDVFGQYAHYFMTEAKIKMTMAEFEASPAPGYMLPEYAVLLVDADLDRLRSFYRRNITSVDTVARVIRLIGLDLSVEALEHVCHTAVVTHDTLSRAVLQHGIPMSPLAAVGRGWLPRTVWHLVLRNPRAPDARSLFERSPVAGWTALQNDAWLQYKRAVRTIQRGFRAAIRARAARVIQAAWRRATSDPGRGVGRRRLMRMFSELAPLVT